MRRIAILASSVWIAVFASIALFTLFWRAGYVRPHALWGILSLVAAFTPMTWLAASVLPRCVRGPCRGRAVGWLLVGATPLVWSGAYLTRLSIDLHTRSPRSLNVPVLIAGVWASSMLDIEARWRYPRWTCGRHAVLIDDGRPPSPEKLVAEMDRHIQAMANLLGRPIPNQQFPWVRGSLLGLHGRAIYVWAICGQAQNAAELAHVDRHEVAHTLITVLSGPDHHPPSLLTEGWAESQSSDRNRQIGDLAKKHKEGRACPLQDLLGPDVYDDSIGPAYSEGGPLVHYLMEHYGPETFFRLYSGVRQNSFHDDCRAILGDSWEAVEENFWTWIEAEAKSLAPAEAKQPDAAPAVHVELAKLVNPADWQAVLDGYRAANKESEPLPSNAAFVREGEQIESKTETPGSAKRKQFEFRAIFEDEQFWIFDNYYHVGADCFLMATLAGNADLVGDDSGSFRGRAQGAWHRASVCEKASDLLAFYRGDAPSLAHFRLLAPRSVSQVELTYHIEQVVRPAQGKTGRWKVEFTRRVAKDESQVRYQLEVDPGQRWWTTRIVGEKRGDWRFETDVEYGRLGDALMPVATHSRRADKQHEVTAHCRARPMSQAERQELKQRVERAVRTGPTDPYRWLRRFLLAIIIACPLGGATLLGVTRRREPPQGTP